MTADTGPQAFTPRTLANLRTPPVFMLKAGTRRDREQYRHAMMVEGLRYHGQDAFRAELRAGMAAGWTAETYAEQIVRVERFWEALDAHQASREAYPDCSQFEYDATEKAALERLFADTTEFWEPLRRMSADNVAHAHGAPRLMAAHIIRGWSTFDVPFGMEAGVLSLDRVEMIEDKLGEIEDQARKDGVDGIETTGTAFLELAAECAARLFPSKDPPAEAPASTHKPKSPRVATPAPTE